MHALNAAVPRYVKPIRRCMCMQPIALYLSKFADDALKMQLPVRPLSFFPDRFT